MRRINVLQMIGEFTSGGAESVVVNLAKSLNREKFSLTFTARKDGPISKNLPVGSEFVILPKRNGFDLRHLLRLIEIIKVRKIDLIHSHLFGPNLFGFLAAKITKKKIIQTIHGRDCFSTWKRILAYRLMLKFTDKIVTVSDPLGTEFRKRVGEDEKATIVHNGIDVGSFKKIIQRDKKLASLGLPTRSKIIGSVGNIKPIKGHENLIQTMAILRKKEQYDVILAIIGEIYPKYASYKTMLDKLITSLGLADRIFFLGFRDDIPEILQAIDYYVLPSISEGLSISLLEAMAASRPIVATDVGMNSVVIQHGVNGLIVPPNSNEALAEALQKVISDPELSEEMGKKARKTVCSKYSSEAMSNRYLKLYEEIVL